MYLKIYTIIWGKYIIYISFVLLSKTILSVSKIRRLPNTIYYIVQIIHQLKVSAKNEELQAAAKLGQQMLERNDELQEELERLQQSHSNLVEVCSSTRKITAVKIIIWEDLEWTMY